MMVCEKPRILFITSSAFNRQTGGGITFTNLFRGWPANKLATVHNDAVPTTEDVCSRYYRLGAGEIGRWPPFLRRYRGSGPPNHSGPISSRRGLDALRRAKNLIVGNAWPDHGTLSAELASWIDEFRPQLLYTILGTVGIMELVERTRRRFDLPLVIHFMDDWASHLYRGGLFSALPRNRMNNLVKRLIDVATDRFVIGDAMAETYENRFGKDFTAFQNAVDLEAVTRHMSSLSPPSRDSMRIRVVYVGSIFANAQLQSLIDVARAVATLANDGHSIQFDVYSPLYLASPFKSDLEASPTTALHDTIENDATFFQTIGNADILIMPANFDSESVRLIRYSMPTKLPAYLASGTPILVYGPPGLAQIEDARRNGWGLVVDQREPDMLSRSLCRLAVETDLRNDLTARAHALAAARHDARVVRRDFQARLIAAARS